MKASLEGSNSAETFSAWGGGAGGRGVVGVGRVGCWGVDLDSSFCIFFEDGIWEWWVIIDVTVMLGRWRIQSISDWIFWRVVVLCWVLVKSELFVVLLWCQWSLKMDDASLRSRAH